MINLEKTLKPCFSSIKCGFCHGSFDKKARKFVSVSCCRCCFFFTWCGVFVSNVRAECEATLLTSKWKQRQLSFVPLKYRELTRYL